MAGAVESAREELHRQEFEHTERVMVFIVAGPPTAIMARWPVRTQADKRNDRGFEPQRQFPPSNCADSQGRHYPEPGWATGDSMPDRTGLLSVLMGGDIRGPLTGVELLESTPSPQQDPKCGFVAPTSSWMSLYQDLAYLPDQDLTGLALDKPRPLVRFSEGPYKDKIRPDVLPNNRMAIANLFENMLRRLNDEGIRVVLVCVFERGYVDMKSLDRALNLPGTAAFDPARPAGMLLTIDDPEQVPRVIERLHSTLAARP